MGRSVGRSVGRAVGSDVGNGVGDRVVGKGDGKEVAEPKIPKEAAKATDGAKGLVVPAGATVAAIGQAAGGYSELRQQLGD